ncbi:MAG: hypothetical protein AAGB00_09585 [Planctomycetota bacterium]
MIRALEIPEEHAARVAWLERELVGPDLPRLASELAALHGAGGEPAVAAELAVDSRLLDRGLSWMDDRQLAALLTHPTTLIGIQRRVLAEDSAYWSRVAPPADQRFAAAVDKTREVVLAAAGAPPTVSVAPAAAAPTPRRSVVWSLAAALATAAALVLTVDTWRPLGGPAAGGVAAVDNDPALPAPTTPPGIESNDPPAGPVADPPATPLIATDQAWGFGKFAREITEGEEQLAPPLDRRAYLNELAVAAEAWGAKTPTNRLELVRRLGEFRLGCSAILMAEHGPLPESDREWLRTRCRSWASAIDRHLAQAESDAELEAVLARVDGTVARIAGALRGRSDTDPRPVS